MTYGEAMSPGKPLGGHQGDISNGGGARIKTQGLPAAGPGASGAQLGGFDRARPDADDRIAWL
jgi:hypothetical protein